MSKKYYKVVYYDHFKNSSIYVYSSAITVGDAEVIYPIGKWAYPPKDSRLGLFIFDTFKNAKRFDNAYKYRIFECEAKGVTKPMACPIIGTWPTGTLMADQVKIIEDVTFREL